LGERRLTIEVSAMPGDIAAPQSTQEARGEKPGLVQPGVRRPELEWQRNFTDLCAEIAWGTDPASDAVRRLVQQCAEALEALARAAAAADPAGVSPEPVRHAPPS
jgi:hypothetical protein